MSTCLEDVDQIRALGPELGGVFSFSDLQNLLGSTSKDAFYRALRGLEEAGVLSRFCRGFYVTPKFDPWILSQRICPESYVSFGNVLAKYLVIGSVPTYRVQAVKPGPTRLYDNGTYRIEHLSVRRGLCFGYDLIEGVRVATLEKACLDTLYFYRQGTRFSFDVYTDIDYSLIDQNVMNDYLGAYRNPVFQDFVRRLIDA